MNNYRFVLKYIIVGAMGSGKSSTLCRFIEDEFMDKEYFEEQPILQSFLSLDFIKCFIQLLFKNFKKENRESLNESKIWLQDAKKYCRSETFFIIIGNKIDFTEREVTYEEGNKFAEENGLEYIETSAKTGQNVSDVFLNTASRIYRNLSEGTWKLKTMETIDEGKLKQDKQTEESENPKSGGCC
ncbi:rab2a [Anaeramoeba flamelloides]|uniref:Rab2a n=1 Tax=Anaeramoeba flamelloides TaxID=1746091 RepID=A0ABQ8XI01_9EUKA|nr:rab2a [Anaeramoeba flamelloides]